MLKRDLSHAHTTLVAWVGHGCTTFQRARLWCLKQRRALWPNFHQIWSNCTSLFHHCSVLQCVVVCCSVLQCVAVCPRKKWNRDVHFDQISKHQRPNIWSNDLFCPMICQSARLCFKHQRRALWNVVQPCLTRTPSVVCAWERSLLSIIWVSFKHKRR